MGADFNNDSHHCSFPREEGSDFSGCSLSASQHALLQDPRVNRERKQKPVPKGTVPHTGDSASYSCDGCAGFVGFRGSEEYVHRLSSAPSIPQLLFAPVFDARPLISRLIANVLVREAYGFYLSNALTHQPISSRHGADVLSRF
ncbi:hypothetical protein N7527_007504 [Penicillium freii]|nr:hypothetical protein N7527_007504 [Penicillium freii]